MRRQDAYGGLGDDTLKGSLGDDVYFVDSELDVIDEQESQGQDIVNSAAIQYTLSAHVEELSLIEQSVATIGIGNALNNKVQGNQQDNLLQGWAGLDSLKGAVGQDTLEGGEGDDSLEGGQGNDVLVGGVGDDLLDGGEGADIYQFNLGDGKDVVSNLSDLRQDTLQIGLYNSDIIFTRKSDDLWLYMNSGYESIYLKNYFYNDGNSSNALGTIQTLEGSYQYLQVRALSVPPATESSDTLTGFSYDENIHGLGGDDTIKGQGGNDTLWGDKGDDVLYGNTGNDTLIGGEGNDSLEGGDGLDVYMIYQGDGHDEISRELSAIGQDKIKWMDAPSTAIQLCYARDYNGYTQIQMVEKNTGQSVLLASSQYGYGGVNTVEFSDGVIWTVAQMEAYIQNFKTPTENQDIFYLGDGHELGDFTNFTINLLGGDDIVYAMGSRAIIQGDAGNDTIYGSYEEDLLYGGIGSDSLYGGAGRDSLYSNIDNTADNAIDYLAGGLDGDAYYVDSSNDKIVEYANEGIDGVYVRSTGDWVLSANVENIYLQTLDETNKVTGNDLDNKIDAGSTREAHRTTSGLGAETLIGGQGNDTYYDVSYNDVVIEAADEGIDTIYMARTDYTLDTYIENVTVIPFRISSGVIAIYSSRNITGNSLDNVMISDTSEKVKFYGGDGNDYLYGNTSNDTLVGGAGNDRLVGRGSNALLYGGEGNNTLSASNGRIYANGSLDKVFGANNDVYIGQGNVQISLYDGASKVSKIHDGASNFQYAATMSGGSFELISASSLNHVFMEVLTNANGNNYLNLKYNATSEVQIDEAAIPRWQKITTSEGSLTIDELKTWLQGHAGHYISHAEFSMNFDSPVTTAWQGTNLVISASMVQANKLSMFDNYQLQNNQLTVLNANSQAITSLQLVNNQYLNIGTTQANDFSQINHLGINDYYLGAVGQNKYAYGIGSGQDAILLSATDNVVDQVFITVASTNVQLIHEANDLVIQLQTGESLRIKQYFEGNVLSPDLIFNDGTQWTVNDVYWQLYRATIGDDVIIGTSANERLLGLSGNDMLQGLAGNDTLDGSSGQDTLM